MKMSNYVHLYPHYLVVEIEKPMYEYDNHDVVRVNKKHIDRAIHNFVHMIVRCKNGERLFYPKAVKKQGKKVKEVFLYENNPMVMYELEIPHCEKKPIEAYQF